MSKKPNTTPNALPTTGYSRMSQMLPFLPIAKNTVYKWVQDGKFPKPVKLSPTVTCWKNEDIHAWLNNLDSIAYQPAANDEGAK